MLVPRLLLACTSHCSASRLLLPLSSVCRPSDQQMASKPFAARSSLRSGSPLRAGCRVFFSGLPRFLIPALPFSLHGAALALAGHGVETLFMPHGRAISSTLLISLRN